MARHSRSRWTTWPSRSPKPSRPIHRRPPTPTPHAHPDADTYAHAHPNPYADTNAHAFADPDAYADRARRPGTYHPLPPARVLDTRSGNGSSARLIAGVPVTFQVAGRLGIPDNAVAITGNVTVVKPSAGWALYLGPESRSKPATSTINFLPDQTVGNGLTVALNGTGSLSATFISSTGNTCDLVVDVTGYFTPDDQGQTYHPIPPARELDTRSGNGLSGRLDANTPRTFRWREGTGCRRRPWP